MVFPGRFEIIPFVTLIPVIKHPEELDMFSKYVLWLSENIFFVFLSSASTTHIPRYIREQYLKPIVLLVLWCAPFQAIPPLFTRRSRWQQTQCFEAGGLSLDSDLSSQRVMLDLLGGTAEWRLSDRRVPHPSPSPYLAGRGLQTGESQLAFNHLVGQINTVLYRDGCSITRWFW